MKQCANCIGWNCENEGNVFWGFLVWCWFLECGVSWSLEALSDGDLLWLFLCGW